MIRAIFPILIAILALFAAPSARAEATCMQKASESFQKNFRDLQLPNIDVSDDSAAAAAIQGKCRGTADIRLISGGRTCQSTYENARKYYLAAEQRAHKACAALDAANGCQGQASCLGQAQAGYAEADHQFEEAEKLVRKGQESVNEYVGFLHQATKQPLYSTLNPNLPAEYSQASKTTENLNRVTKQQILRELQEGREAAHFGATGLKGAAANLGTAAPISRVTGNSDDTAVSGGGQTPAPSARSAIALVPVLGFLGGHRRDHSSATETSTSSKTDEGLVDSAASKTEPATTGNALSSSPPADQASASATSAAKPAATPKAAGEAAAPAFAGNLGTEASPGQPGSAARAPASETAAQAPIASAPASSRAPYSFSAPETKEQAAAGMKALANPEIKAVVDKEVARLSALHPMSDTLRERLRRRLAANMEEKIEENHAAGATGSGDVLKAVLADMPTKAEDLAAAEASFRLGAAETEAEVRRLSGGGRAPADASSEEIPGAFSAQSLFDRVHSAHARFVKKSDAGGKS